MIKNNQGVTLVELLIVIVVMGIVAAFAVPAVGTIIENTQRDAILADALAVEQAAKLYCSSNTCTSTQGLTQSDLEGYVDGIDWGYYDTTATGNVTDATYIAELDGSGNWGVWLENATDNTATSATDEWEWTPGAVPSDSDRSQVVNDEN